MRQSQLFTKTLREAPKDEVSANAILLERGGFVYKNSAGVYSYLPLGWRVAQKIMQIIREEMNAIGGEEMFMPALVEKKYLDATKRWDSNVGFDVVTKDDPDPRFALGWTHEEVLTAIAARYISSYKDLPFAAYQIQTKFRNEARAKSGLLRGREFMMKDLYSFHADEADLFTYYEKVRDAYFRIFERCGLKTYYTVAAGGAFTAANTHEFQVLAEAGEDTILLCGKCGRAENKEISKLKEGGKCPKCGGAVAEKNAIEVGNIFPLGTKYSEAFNLVYADEKGKKHFVVMGSYGIGIGRVMGAVVEVHYDDKGIIWPESVAPFRVHLIELGAQNEERRTKNVREEAEKFYNELQQKGVEVLWDDRDDKTPGEKFADADLLGIPTRVVISERSLEKGGGEVKKRAKTDATIVELDKIVSSVL